MRFHFHKKQWSIQAEDEHLNDLKEFGVDTDEPDLFNSNTHTANSDDLLGSSEDNIEDEDDLEIPAFLRRQKINGRKNKWKPPWYRMLQNIIRYCLMK